MTSSRVHLQASLVGNRMRLRATLYLAESPVKCSRTLLPKSLRLPLLALPTNPTPHKYNNISERILRPFSNCCIETP